MYTIEYKIGVAYQTSLCQYDLTRPTPAAIGASRLVLAQQVLTNPITLDKGGQGRFADVQLAPDGTVWVGDLQQLNKLRSPTAAVDVQPKAVDIIRHPNVVGPGCQLELEAYPLPGRASPAQFPNVVANMLYPPPALEVEVSCSDSARFWPNSAQDGTSRPVEFWRAWQWPRQRGNGPLRGPPLYPRRYLPGNAYLRRRAATSPYPGDRPPARPTCLTRISSPRTGTGSMTLFNSFRTVRSLMMLLCAYSRAGAD
ncbi:MAG: hypothetical protein WKG07_21720 [Hymenobacter sp.]